MSVKPTEPAYQETGEYRPPRKGEWFLPSTGNRPKLAPYDLSIHSAIIVEPIEWVERTITVELTVDDAAELDRHPMRLEDLASGLLSNRAAHWRYTRKEDERRAKVAES